MEHSPAGNDALEAEIRYWHEAATIDSLTRLPNRLAMTEALDELAETQPGNFAVAFIDLDGLKTTNDSQGHKAGDALLIKASEVLASNIRTHETEQHPEPRPHDLPGQSAFRLSGDEFVVIFRGITESEHVAAISKRLHRKLQSAKIPASIGARLHEPGESGAEILEAVDELMYQQKRLRHRQAQEQERARLQPEVRQEAQAIVERLDALGIGVNGLKRMFGDSSR